MPKNSADRRGPCAAGLPEALISMIRNQSENFWLNQNTRKPTFDGFLKLADSRLQGQRLSGRASREILAHRHPMAMVSSGTWPARCSTRSGAFGTAGRRIVPAVASRVASWGPDSGCGLSGFLVEVQ